VSNAVEDGPALRQPRRLNPFTGMIAVERWRLPGPWLPAAHLRCCPPPTIAGLAMMPLAGRSGAKGKKKHNRPTGHQLENLRQKQKSPTPLYPREALCQKRRKKALLFTGPAASIHPLV
jgi:hypothetical protein